MSRRNNDFYGLGDQKRRNKKQIQQEDARIESAFRGKEVTVFRNGDISDPGTRIRVSKKAFPAWRSFLEYLNKKIFLPTGPIYMVVNTRGEGCISIDDLEDGKQYVAITEKFIPVNYGHNTPKSWDITPRLPTKDPAPLFSDESEMIISEKMERKLSKIQRVNTGFNLKERARSVSPPKQRYPQPTKEPKASYREKGRGNTRSPARKTQNTSPFYSSKKSSQPAKFVPRRKSPETKNGYNNKSNRNNNSNFYAKENKNYKGKFYPVKSF